MPTHYRTMLTSHVQFRPGVSLQIVSKHLRLSVQLFLRYGLILSAIWAGGALLHQILLRVAVELGMYSRLLGLVAIAPVVLLQLLIFVGLFIILRDGLPQLRLLRGRVDEAIVPPAPTDAGTGGTFGLALLAVLVPFYGYYAGWGFLNDTLRSYSQIFYRQQMARVDFTQPELPPTALEVGQTAWVVLAVLLIWLIRRVAKARNNARPGGLWAMLIVACEGTWALLGLYVLAAWKAEFAGWLATLPRQEELFEQIIPQAAAATTDPLIRPVDWPASPSIGELLNSLFWYALLPLVWFNLGAIVYGHDMQSVRGETQRATNLALERWKALPKPVADFIGHFWSGVIKRWHGVVNGVLLAASAGAALTVSVLVLWRLVDWAGNWAWIGLSHLIGPQDMLIWQVVSVPLNILFNAPGGPPGGLLVAPLQFCILAAGLEIAGRSDQAHNSTPKAKADAGPA